MTTPPIARALEALAAALHHVPVARLNIDADEASLIVAVVGEDDLDRTLLVSQLAERLNLPEPHTSRINQDGARVTTSDTPAYCPGVTVVVWTPVTARLAVAQ